MYIANYLLADMRLYNCNRSTNAVVIMHLSIDISIFKDDKLEKFRTALQKYIDARQRHWDSIVCLRHDDVDANEEQVLFTLAVSHHKFMATYSTHQNFHSADMLRCIYDTTELLGVSFSSPPYQNILYYGGALEDGTCSSTKNAMVQKPNVQSMAGLGIDPAKKSV